MIVEESMAALKLCVVYSVEAGNLGGPILAEGLAAFENREKPRINRPVTSRYRKGDERTSKNTTQKTCSGTEGSQYVTSNRKLSSHRHGRWSLT